MEKLTSQERHEMSAAVQTMLRDYAGTRWPSLNHKGRMARLAGVLGFTHRRVRALYQNEDSVRLRADELQTIEALRRQREADNAVRQSQAEYRDLEARIAALEALFASGDEEHGRPFLDGFRALAFGEGGGPLGSSSRNGPEGE